MRSISGPEIFPTYRWICIGEHLHSRWLPKYPHGHRSVAKMPLGAKDSPAKAMREKPATSTRFPDCFRNASERQEETIISNTKRSRGASGGICAHIQGLGSRRGSAAD